MANEIVYHGNVAFEANLTGVTAEIRTVAGAVAAGSPVALTETPSGSAVFLGNFPALAAGRYLLRIKNASGVTLGQGEQYWDGFRMSAQDDVSLSRKILQNETTTNPATGVMEVLDDDGSSLLVAGVFNDAAKATAYDGTAGVNARERLDP